MKVTYFALRPVQVGDEIREPGDLIPEAATWQYLDGYVRDGRIQPVLVATLPRKTQDVLQEWEDHYVASQNPQVTPATSIPSDVKENV